MLQVTFQTDGKVQVFAIQDGDVISVTTEASKLPVMLPKETHDALLAGIIKLHDTLVDHMWSKPPMEFEVTREDSSAYATKETA